MSDTLILCSATGDALRLDVIEPDRPHLAIYFASPDELTDLLARAHDAGGISSASCRHALNDALSALVERETRQRVRQILERCPVPAKRVTPFWGDFCFGWQLGALTGVLCLALWALLHWLGRRL